MRHCLSRILALPKRFHVQEEILNLNVYLGLLLSEIPSQALWNFLTMQSGLWSLMYHGMSIRSVQKFGSIISPPSASSSFSYYSIYLSKIVKHPAASATVLEGG